MNKIYIKEKKDTEQEKYTYLTGYIDTVVKVEDGMYWCEYGYDRCIPQNMRYSPWLPEEVIKLNWRNYIFYSVKSYFNLKGYKRTFFWFQRQKDIILYKINKKIKSLLHRFF